MADKTQCPSCGARNYTTDTLCMSYGEPLRRHRQPASPAPVNPVTPERPAQPEHSRPPASTRDVPSLRGAWAGWSGGVDDYSGCGYRYGCLFGLAERIFQELVWGGIASLSQKHPTRDRAWRRKRAVGIGVGVVIVVVLVALESFWNGW